MALDDATVGLLTQLVESGAKPLHELTPEEARGAAALLSSLSGPGPEVAKVYDVSLPASDGNSFTVRVLIPAGDVQALVVYYHGGGFVLGNIEDYDNLARTLANSLHAAVVNVDYRLAPEHQYPTAPDDAWAALTWAAGRMAEIAGGPVPLIVMGDSAGGNLSAVVAQKARDAGGPELAAQVLIYPVTDADLDGPCYINPENQLILTREAMIWFWDHYAPDPASRGNMDASPSQVASVTGVAPAIVLTAEYDVLRDEGEAYAERLREAGLLLAQRRFAGQMHGFFTMVNVLPGSADAIAYITEELGRHLEARAVA